MLRPSPTLSRNRAAENPADPLRRALLAKARAGSAGSAVHRTIIAGPGWRAADIVCTCGPHDHPFEERHAFASVSLVLSGTFSCRSDHGTALFSAGSLMLLAPGQSYECSHRHGEGDRCISFHFAPELFERLAHDAGASRAAFASHRLPPLRALAGLTARVGAGIESPATMEEIAVAVAGAAVREAGPVRRSRTTADAQEARIVRVLRRLESDANEPHALADLAASVGLSPYHFLRSFKRVTGVTPHQWLLRSRLREAARRLAASRQPITDIALDVGFDDLSNFLRSFRAEFGTSPRRYRMAGA